MSTQEGSRALPSRWLLIRDIGIFLLGAAIGVREILQPEVRDAVLLFCGTLLGGPLALQAGQAVREVVQSRSGTGTSSSPSPEVPPSPSGLS